MARIVSILPVLVWASHRPTYGLPVGPTGPSAPAYVPSPQGRGTVELLLSCVLTLILCVWTAIHINIFPTGTKLRDRILWKTVWTLTAQVVVWTALTQWRNAKRIQKERNQTLKFVLQERRMLSGKDFDVEYNRQAWTLCHAFFAIMGGLEVAFEERYDWILEKSVKGEKRRTLTEFGWISLAKLELLPFINAETIKARSKADQLAKLLVCFQAVWMVIQVVARKAEGLPVTLLELNTLAHVSCAVVLYVLWWHKPLNVEEPLKVKVSDPDIMHVLIWNRLPYHAFKPILSQQQGEDDISNGTYPPRTSNVRPGSRSQKHDEVEHGKREGGLVGNPSTAVRQKEVGNGGLGLPTRKHFRKHALSGYQVIGKPLARGSVCYLCRDIWGNVAPDLELRTGSNLVLLPGQSISGIPFQHRLGNVAAFLNAEDIKRLELWRDIREAHGESDREIPPSLSNCLSAAAPNAPVDDAWDTLDDFYGTRTPLEFLGFLHGGIHAPLAVLSLIYGGIHASSWNGHFPSYVERLIWQIAVCVVAGGGLFVLTIFWVVSLLSRITSKRGASLLQRAYVHTMFLLLFPFAIARIFLVVESFISVRSLPVGAYNTTNWINLLPHIG